MSNSDPLANVVVSQFGFTKSELQAAFEKVQHPENWKFGNKAIIERADFLVTNEATIFFAGSPLKVISGLKPGSEKFEVEFAGYYACIGA